MKGLSLFLFIAASVTLSSCYYDKEDKLYERYLANLKCDSTSVTYAKSIEPVIANQCATAGCHVAGGNGPGDFSSYAGVKAKVDNGSFLRRTSVTLDMPPNTQLTKCEIAQIEIWIRQGAINN